MHKKKMKTAYIGIDILYPVLEALLQEGCQLMKVFTCQTDNVTEFNTAVTEAARKQKIPLQYDRITREDLEQLKTEGCELIVCAGYYYRIPIIEGIPMINVHPSPLPLGKGAWPMPLIIKKELPFGGVAMHKMTEKFDSGEILLEETFPIRKEETLQTYMEQLASCIPDMVHRLVTELPELLQAAVPQEEGEYWPNPNEEEWTVTPDMEVEEADRILRAFYGYECIYQSEDGRFELIKGRARRGKQENCPFPVRGGYLYAERVRQL